MWDVLFAAAYKLSARESVVLFEEMAHLLPCVHCRTSYGTYLSQVAPRACIKEGDTRSAARWVWMMHDMVNQKLGHSTMPFARVEARHAVFDEYVTPSDVLHVMALMALDLEREEDADAYARAAPSLCALLIALEGPPACAVAVEDDMCTAAGAWVHALTCRNAFRRARGGSPLSRGAFMRHYAPCRAPDADNVIEHATTHHAPQPSRVSRRPSRRHR